MTPGRSRLERYAGLAVPIACIAVVWLGVTFGSRAASGADSLGYVSQAYLWLDGTLRLEQPLADEAPWPHAHRSFAPLGYTIGDGNAVVPVYSIGVPLIMAGFLLALGACGPYLVAPLAGALLVAMTFVLGARLTGSRLTGSIAALLMASSPAFLFNIMWPMSDTVTAALWISALALLTWPGVRPAAVAGLLAGFAVLARPNLVPLAAACMAAAWMWAAPPARARRAVAFLVSGVVPAALLVAAINQHLFGSPLMSGYGPASSLYSPGFVWTNVRQYAAWFAGTEWPALLALLLLPLVRPPRVAPSPRPAFPVALFAVIVLASYLFYLPFDEWWYLRFVLPAFPLAFIGIAALIAAGMWRMPAAAAVPASAILLILIVGGRTAIALDRRVLEIGRDEDRYVSVARFVTRALPENAVIFSKQHSGSLWFYSGRTTVKYEWFEPLRLPSAIAWFRDRGFHPYLVLDASEETLYRSRFGETSAPGRLAVRVVGEMREPVPIKVYDLLDPVEEATPGHGIVPRVDRTCVPPSPDWPGFSFPPTPDGTARARRSGR